MDPDVVRVVDALKAEHREEVGKLAMQLALYRDVIVDAGLEPPDRDGEDLLRLWQTTAEVMVAVAELIHVYGTSKEMILQQMKVSKISPAAERFLRPA